MRSERWMTPGTYSRPAEPMPFTRPNLAPLALTHSGPLGPSTTWGMRSFSAAAAFLVKRSGGSQIRSTCPSAEMTSYFISAFLPGPANSRVRRPANRRNGLGSDTVHQDQIAAERGIPEMQSRGIFRRAIPGPRLRPVRELHDDDRARPPGPFHRLDRATARQVASAIAGDGGRRARAIGLDRVGVPDCDV